jgi:hypothetical protein
MTPPVLPTSPSNDSATRPPGAPPYVPPPSGHTVPSRTGNPEIDALIANNPSLAAYLGYGPEKQPPVVVPPVVDNPVGRGPTLRQPPPDLEPPPAPSGHRLKSVRELGLTPPSVYKSEAPEGLPGPAAMPAPPDDLHGDTPRDLMPPPPPPGERPASAYDATRPNEVWVLPHGEVTGYGGKLDYDVNSAYAAEWGEGNPWKAEMDARRAAFRARIAERGLTPEQLRAELNNTAEGAEFNLNNDELGDEWFARRVYREAMGRDPTGEEIADWTSRLSQGVEREAFLDHVKNSDAFKGTGRTWNKAAIDKVLAQGDAFKGALKDDDLERELFGVIKDQLGRAPTERELLKYTDAVRSGKIKREATDTTTPEQVAQTFFSTLFGADYQASPQEVEMIRNMLSNTNESYTPDMALRQYAATRRQGQDYLSRGRNVDDNAITNAMAQLRMGNTNSQLIDMLKKRKAAGFADGGRVALKDTEDGKKINAKQGKPSERPIRQPKTGTGGIRGRKDDGEVEPEEFNAGGRVSGFMVEDFNRGGRVDPFLVEDFNRGGRVKTRAAARGLKRAPVTIDQPKGYADGGRAGSADTDNPSLTVGEGALREQLLDYAYRNNQDANSEAGSNGRSPIDLDSLRNMSTAELLRWVKQNGGGEGAGGTNRMGEIAIDDDDPLVAQFLQQHGARDWGDVEAPDSNNQLARGYVMGYGDPTYGRESRDGRTILADGTRILKLPDGRYIREAANINSDEVAGQQRADETDWRRERQDTRRMVAAALTMGVAGQAGAFGATAGGELAAAPGGGFGTYGSGFSSYAGTHGAAGAAGAAGSGVNTVNVPENLPTNGTPSGGSTPLDPMPDIYNPNTPGGPGDAAWPGYEGNPPPGGAPGGGSGVPTVDVPGNLPLNNAPPATGTPLVDAPAITQGPSGWQQAAQWIRNNPERAARLGLSVAGLFSGSDDGSQSGNPAQYRPGDGGTYTPGGNSFPRTGAGYTIGRGGTGVQTAPTWRGYAAGGIVLPNYMPGTRNPLAPLDDTVDPTTGMPVGMTTTPVGRSNPRAAGITNPVARGAAPTWGTDPANPIGRGDQVQNPVGRTGDQGGMNLGRGRGDPAADPTNNPIGRGPSVPLAPGRGDGLPSGAPAASPAPAAAGGSTYLTGGTSGVGGGSSSTLGSPAGAAASDPIRELLAIGRGQIERYRRFDPLERQVIAEAGQAGGSAQQEEDAALAGETVAGQFDRQRAMLRRRDPTRAAALGVQYDVGEGGAKAYAMNEARRASRDGGFGKRMAALGLGDGALKTGLGAVSGGVSALLDQDRTAAGREATAQQTSVAMSNIGARMQEAELQRMLERERLAQQGGQFDRTFTEGTRRYDQGFTEDQRRWGRGAWERDRAFDYNVYTGDRDFDLDVWRTNTGQDRYADERDYNRRRQRSQDIGSGVRTAAEVYRFGDDMDWWADGGRVKAKKAQSISYDEGGEVPGVPHPNPNKDTVPAMLRPGEGVVNVEGMNILDKVAPGLFDMVNERGLAMRKMGMSRAAARGIKR